MLIFKSCSFSLNNVNFINNKNAASLFFFFYLFIYFFWFLLDSTPIMGLCEILYIVAGAALA